MTLLIFILLLFIGLTIVFGAGYWLGRKEERIDHEIERDAAVRFESVRTRQTLREQN